MAKCLCCPDRYLDNSLLAPDHHSKRAAPKHQLMTKTIRVVASHAIRATSRSIGRSEAYVEVAKRPLRCALGPGASFYGCSGCSARPHVGISRPCVADFLGGEA